MEVCQRQEAVTLLRDHGRAIELRGAKHRVACHVPGDVFQLRETRRMHRGPMKHLLVVLGVLLGAVVCYLTGFGLGIGLLVVAGAVLELVFWILALTSSAGSRKAP